MTITAALCNSFKQELLAMTPHAAGDTYKLALYTSTATLNKSTTAYSATNEVSGAGYTAGGITLTGFAVSLDTDTAILDFADASLSNATITAAGGLIYNSTQANKAVAVVSFGGDVTSTAGTFNIPMPAPAAATGLIRIA